MKKSELKITPCIRSDFEFIWGILSKDDISGAKQAGLYTMNDFDIIYWTEDNSYSFEVETIYDISKQWQEEYLKNILNKFTDWMKANQYDTEYHLDYYQIFTNFDRSVSISELYAKFKLLVGGFCKNIENY